MPKSMLGLVGLLPTADDQAPIETTEMGSIHSIENGGTGDEMPRAIKPSKETCLACGFFWKSWCGFEPPTWHNTAWLSSCPKPEDTPIPSPGFEELYGQEALRRCMDCLVRSQCTRFVGLAWFIPDCKQFKTDN